MCSFVSRSSREKGFSLVEILLVLAIIGIISGIAIPSYLGQRRRARVIGDAMANARVISMLLESRKADTGVYGAEDAYKWTAGTPDAKALGLLPSFTPNGNSKMDYNLVIANGGLSYELTIVDPSLSGTPTAYKTNQNGAELARLK